MPSMLCLRQHPTKWIVEVQQQGAGLIADQTVYTPSPGRPLVRFAQGGGSGQQTSRTTSQATECRTREHGTP